MTIRQVASFPKYNHKQYQANCLPIFLANDELRFRRIRCNATVLCYCATNNTNLPVLMTTQLVENKCEGGEWTCSPPKECCKQGCCFLFNQPFAKGSAGASLQHGTVFNPLFLGHWYFWLAVTATVAGILCACSLWRKHNQGRFCCKDHSRDERASEQDSVTSCCPPPQYSRCNSFHQAPPPYSEVTSKPDLYPLVISYNAEPVTKSNNSSTGYLMVQYFRNFIVRPAGSLSATSTIDSLSSSFLCNAVNEANSIIPPPYSHMGSLEEITTEHLIQNAQQPLNQRNLPRSASSTSSRDYFQLQQNSESPNPSLYSQSSTPCLAPVTPAHQLLRTPSPKQQQLPQHQVLSIRNNPCYVENSTTNNTLDTSSSTVPNNELGRIENKSQNVCDVPAIASTKTKQLQRHKITKEDSESQEDDPNFSDLLNLSVCLPSSVPHFENPIQTVPEDLQYSVTNSIGSDISSLANMGSPGSPPRATSPTVEMRELLDKIQQLPQQKSPIPPQPQANQQQARNYFHKVKSKTLYMPLCDETPTTLKSISNVFSRSWLSRSAPCTPCGNFVPNFQVNHHKGSQRGSKSKISDGSPLLREEESEDEPHRDPRS
ncbi:uncharacterized protein LOC130894006 isoform X5 [Diorhabda carinulata]|uniref:uncharacterized protein LOC130894006 isoform X5 n=1 Tax=Diorhabda carinulata TaxID=1163345 RepID=UPI0025A173DF|nr:uncharacterized protein LOC130894006 isoform X5 [Diorhabda carinulata]XP_057656479.1 uncharacterized protein LOC130894006 isoform X5 [Diorhabda carinulata]